MYRRLIPRQTLSPQSSLRFPRSVRTKMSFPYPTITVEEHWLSQSVRDFYDANSHVANPYSDKSLMSYILPTLMDFGSKRLQSMDDSNIAIQVVSHAPNSLGLDVATCTKVNDEIHAHIQSQPSKRFAGFATLPMTSPLEASQELHRCITDLNFVGALIDSNCNGRFYDDAFFWPVFEAATSLSVPIYLHPSPNEHVKPLLYDGNYPAAISEVLSQFGWGWHSETATHFLRLYAAGVFDRFPSLQLVLGHMGEMLPFQLERVESITNAWPKFGYKLERTLRKVWDENVWVSTSGMNYLTPLLAVLRQCKHDRILYSVDYPFGSNEKGLQFLELLRKDGVVSEEVLKGIAYGNAERLLGIKVDLKGLE